MNRYLMLLSAAMLLSVCVPACGDVMEDDTSEEEMGVVDMDDSDDASGDDDEDGDDGGGDSGDDNSDGGDDGDGGDNGMSSEDTFAAFDDESNALIFQDGDQLQIVFDFNPSRVLTTCALETFDMQCGSNANNFTVNADELVEGATIEQGDFVWCDGSCNNSQCLEGEALTLEFGAVNEQVVEVDYTYTSRQGDAPVSGTLNAVWCDDPEPNLGEE